MIEPDTKDWTWVLDRRCPQCGFDAASVDRASVGASTRAAVVAMESAMSAPGASQRPSPSVWSPVEYACHVRDVCIVFGTRLASMRAHAFPTFPNWDQDATATEADYASADPVVVAAELATEGARVAADFESVRDAEWARSGRRSNGSVFTVDTLARYFLHDLVHHVWDVQR